MKRLILLAFCSWILTGISAQTNVRLNLHHMLGNEDFAAERTAVNNLNTPFKITRLEYYLSEITLVHDGGIETPVTDMWILTNVMERSSYELGDFDIVQLEKIIFHVGVDPDHNNADPSVYPEGHPLSLKIPSMHWGWASGYNFVALEGAGGDDFGTFFQVHALGNENYKKVELVMDTHAKDGVLNIDINADYNRAMEDMDAGIGIFYHGPTKFAIQLMGNFEAYVFSPGSNTASGLAIDQARTAFTIQPNIVPGGNPVFRIRTDEAGPFDLTVTDNAGCMVKRLTGISGDTYVTLPALTPGIYYVSRSAQGRQQATQRLLIR